MDWEALKGNEEDCIRNHKYGLIVIGYEYVWKESDRILRTFEEPYRLKFHHLLSIARWEHQRETRDKPVGFDDDGDICGLCLYQISLPGDNTRCTRGDRCVLINGSNGCCKEYHTCHKDNALALIQRLRREYINKYYKEDA